MNPGIRILPLPSAPAFPEGGWAGRGQGNSLFLGWEAILEGGWATSWPTTWRGGNDTIILLFSLKALEILHQERRGQVKKNEVLIRGIGLRIGMIGEFLWMWHLNLRVPYAMELELGIWIAVSLKFRWWTLKTSWNSHGGMWHQRKCCGALEY